MISSILDLLNDSSLVKFFSITGVAFLFFSAIGKVWGIKGDLNKSSRILLLGMSLIMLFVALIGYSEMKNNFISNNFISKKPVIEEFENTAIEKINTQSVKGKKNNTIGEIKGDKNKVIQGNKNVTSGDIQGNNNKVAQGNNNDLSTGKSNQVNSSYKEGDYIIHFTYNKISGDTISKRYEQIKSKTPKGNQGLPQEELGAPTGDVIFGNNCNLVKNEWTISNRRGIINFFNPEGNNVGFSGEFRPQGDYAYYDGDFIEGTAIVYANDKIVLKGKGDNGNFTAILRNLEKCYLSGELTFTKTNKKHSIILR